MLVIYQISKAGFVSIALKVSFQGLEGQKKVKGILLLFGAFLKNGLKLPWDAMYQLTVKRWICLNHSKGHSFFKVRKG